MQDPSTFFDYPVWVYFEINYTLSLVHNPMLYMVYRFYCFIKGECIVFV